MNARKKVFYLLVLPLCALLCGCETLAGMGKGLAYGIGYTIEGAGKDIYNVYNSRGFIKTADDWIKENLW